MSASSPKGGLAELVALAQEPSSERRRDVLREVTDLFMATPETVQAQASGAFDGVMQTLLTDMETAVRAELARRLADAPHAPGGVVRRLANDEIGVAGMVLKHSRALTEEDLLGVVRSRGQAHLRAVSERKALPETVSDVIVERGDDDTLGVLLRNQDAALSRRSAETVVDRAQVNPDLHEAVVYRQNLPPDLLNEMYLTVSARLRRTISERNAALDPAALEAALKVGRTRVATQDGLLPPDYEDAEIYVRGVCASGGVLAHALAGMLRAGKHTRFLVALAQLTEVEFVTAARIVERKDFDALGVLCKSADLDRALFVTLVVLMEPGGGGLKKGEEYGKVYAQLSRETAQRTLRFWRMRRETELQAA